MTTHRTGTASLSPVAWRRALAMLVATTVMWLLIAGVPRPVDAAGASTCTLTPTPGTIMRQVDGRRYALNVPQGLPGPLAPLLLALHGFTQLPTDHEATTGWSQVAATQHFIVAYPSAQPERGAWNFSQGSSDVVYLRDVVKDIAGTWCVDRHHIMRRAIPAEPS